MLPLLLFLAVTADRLVPVMFGNQWTGTIGPLRVLAITGMLRSVSRPIGAANEALGFVWYQTLIQCCTVALIVVGIALLAPWGLTAAAMGVLGATIVHTALNMNMLVRFTPIAWSDLARSVGPSLATSAAVAGAVTAAHVAAVSGGVTRAGYLMTIDVATACVSYFALLLWTPFASVADVVQESVDDLVPWVRRVLPFGVLRPSGHAG
jgi:O-antigen/teichoic acid export membrane protein